MNNKKNLLPRHILITGGTGLIGRHLSRALLASGNKVTVLTRNLNKASQLLDKNILLIDSLDRIPDTEHIDVIVNLSGEPISQRWTDTIKKRIIDSRIGITQHIIHLIQRLEHQPDYFLSGSAVGIYGESETDVFTETSVISSDSLSPSFSQHLCMTWEATAKQAEALGIKTAYLRTGIVLSTQGGALAAMLPAFKLGLGGKIGRGNQWFSWIHIEDMVHIINALIDQEMTGIINATAPVPVTNTMFTKALGKTLKRPTWFSLPSWLIRCLFAEMGNELLLKGQQVVPERMLSSGFTFTYPDVEQTLADVIQYKK